MNTAVYICQGSSRSGLCRKSECKGELNSCVIVCIYCYIWGSQGQIKNKMYKWPESVICCLIFFVSRNFRNIWLSHFFTSRCDFGTWKVTVQRVLQGHVCVCAMNNKKSLQFNSIRTRLKLCLKALPVYYIIHHFYPLPLYLNSLKHSPWHVHCCLQCNTL